MAGLFIFPDCKLHTVSRYFKIGKLVATHGFRGDFVLKHNLGRKTALKGLEKIFLEESKDSFIPYFVEKAASRSDEEVLVKVEGLDSPEAGKKLLQKEVWLAEEDFEKYAAKSAPIAFLGYTIRTTEETIGEIIEVIEQPHQVLCKVMYKNREALIPVHENNLLHIDKKKKIIEVDLPEGLLEIYSD